MSELNITTRLSGINSIRVGMAKNIKVYKNQTKQHYYDATSLMKGKMEDGVGD